MYARAALTEIWGFYYLISSIASTELAILNNFVWSELWTFRDTYDDTKSGVRERLLKVHLSRYGGAILGLLLLILFTERARVNCMKTSNIKKYVAIIVYFLFNIFTIFMPRIYIHGLVLMALILIIYLYKVSKKNTPLLIKPG